MRRARVNSTSRVIVLCEDGVRDSTGGFEEPDKLKNNKHVAPSQALESGYRASRYKHSR